jgi:hypothetical protein
MLHRWEVRLPPTALSVPLLGFTRHLHLKMEYVESCLDHMFSGNKVKLFALGTHVPVDQAVTDTRAR